MLACFMLEATNTVRRSLRRYTHHPSAGWTCAEGWHEAVVPFDDAPAVWEDSTWGGVPHRVLAHVEEERPPNDDPRWPITCAHCAYVFTPADAQQFFYDLLWERVDTGERMMLRDAPPGAMWDAHWLHGYIEGPDGRSLMVKCPNGRDWFIDGQASNCPMQDYQQRQHHCWVRHGVPPLLVVDKNGVTCTAGAGSIQAGDYHGFLGTGGAPPGYFT